MNHSLYSTKGSTNINLDLYSTIRRLHPFRSSVALAPSLLPASVQTLTPPPQKPSWLEFSRCNWVSDTLPRTLSNTTPNLCGGPSSSALLQTIAIAYLRCLTESILSFNESIYWCPSMNPSLYSTQALPTSTVDSLPTIPRPALLRSSVALAPSLLLESVQTLFASSP